MTTAPDNPLAPMVVDVTSTGTVQRSARRGYDAAKVDRTNAYWRPTNRAADLELLADADAIRARARDLVRNNAYARGILRAELRNVVGCGIKPQARVETADGTPNEEFNRAAEQLFARWQRVADVSGRMTFYELQRLALSEVREAGEVLVHFVRDDDDRARPLPFAIELIEADRLASDRLWPRGVNPDTGNEVRRGVEINAKGQAVAYWLYPTNPNDLNTLLVRPVRHDAADFLHLYRVDRVGQTRGVSDFAISSRWGRNLHYYVDNEMQSSAVASCFTAAVTTMGGPADGGLVDTIDDDATDADGNSFEYMQPGMVARLMPGEDVKVIDPSRGQTESKTWVDLMLRSMGVGHGMSYERVARDYSQTNFSSNRASDLEDRREFRPTQDWLIEHMCVPVWQRFIVAAVEAAESGRLGFDEFPSATQLLGNHHHWTAVEFRPPGWEWVDPKNQAIAIHQALEDNMTTLADELGAKGKDWREVLLQRAAEKKYMRERGLTAADAAQAVTGPVEPSTDGPDAE